MLYKMKFINFLRNNIFPQFQNMSHEICIIYKGENSNFTVEKPDIHHRKQMFKVISFILEQNNTMCLLTLCNEKGTK